MQLFNVYEQYSRTLPPKPLYLPFLWKNFKKNSMMNTQTETPSQYCAIVPLRPIIPSTAWLPGLEFMHLHERGAQRLGTMQAVILGSLKALNSKPFSRWRMTAHRTSGFSFVLMDIVCYCTFGVWTFNTTICILYNVTGEWFSTSLFFLHNFIIQTHLGPWLAR